MQETVPSSTLKEFDSIVSEVFKPSSFSKYQSVNVSPGKDSKTGKYKSRHIIGSHEDMMLGHKIQYYRKQK